MTSCNGTITLFSSLYLAPVEYYSALNRCDRAIIEINDSYGKQSYRNRTVIAGANGPISLSIPIEKPHRSENLTKDVRISDHGNWRHLHWNAIISAYNSTPFFQFYEDDFRPFYEKKIPFLHDFNEQLRILVCKLTGIEKEVTYSESYITEPADNNINDMRETIHPKRKSDFKTKPYYQVFSDKQGFQNNLSIIDLLFNMGNESRFYL